MRGLADEIEDKASTYNNATNATVSNSTAVLVEAEIEHEYDAVTTLFLNLCIICCLMLAYYVKKFRIYSFPESTGALLVGVVIGGIARFSTENLTLFEFVRMMDLKRKTREGTQGLHHLLFQMTCPSRQMCRLFSTTVTRSLLFCPVAAHYF